MKKMALFATVAALGLSAGANAQVTLTNAEVRGPTGTVWDTTPNGFYTLFLQNPGLGDFLNPNDEAINLSVSNSGVTRALLAGEGFPTNTTFDSDPVYNLLLSFSNGSTLSGSYTPTTNTFVGGSSFSVGNVTYSLIEFSYRRFLGDAVNQFQATPGGDGNDYVGNFRINAVAGVVPEPAAWAMMIVGIGAVGGSMRVRRRNAKISFA